MELSDLNVHGLNSVLMLLDLAVCARPTRILHVLHAHAYGITYAAWSAVYWSLDHERNVLYPNVLDWNQPGVTMGVVAGLALVGIPVLQLFNLGVFKLRLYVYERVYGEKYLYEDD